MSNYQYLPITEAKSGDIVECTKSTVSAFTKGELYVLAKDYDSTPWNSYQPNLGTLHVKQNNQKCPDSVSAKIFRLVKTKPSNQVKRGDSIISLTAVPAARDFGEVLKVTSAEFSGFEYLSKRYGNAYGRKYHEFLILCKPESTLTKDVFEGTKVKVTPKTHQTSQHKEHTMAASNTNIEIKVNGESITLPKKEEKVKTDLQQAPRCITVIYHRDGSVSSINQGMTKKEAAKYLQSEPSHIGYTTRTYVFAKGAQLTTEIPVVES